MEVEMKIATIAMVAGLVLFTSAPMAHAKKNAENNKLIKKVEKNLVDASGKKVKADLDAPEYLLIYYSAHWCPPCRTFTPKLVEFYNENKSKAKFELIFVSSDKTEEAMKEYMTSTSMPWKAVNYKDIQSSGIGKFSGSGIPCLVLFDKERNVIADSFDGQKYLGPQQVLDKFREIIEKADAGNK
jgi:thiol-disulfide isomerase/thioredoxin